MSLAESTIKKAEKLVTKNLIQQLDENTYQVAGSNEGEIYEVSKSDNADCDLICYKTNTNIDPTSKRLEQKPDICKGWKFKRDCKHCQAVRIFRSQK